MNSIEETTVANTLLGIATSDQSVVRDRLQAYQHMISTTTVQAQRYNGTSGMREAIPDYRDYARHRHALMAQASDRSLDTMTRNLAQQQLETIIENYTSMHSSFRDNPKPLDIERLLSTEGVVVYGSRALNVNRNSSDYDLAFSYESHRMIYEYLKVNNIPISNNTSYFTSVPEAGYHTFFQYMGEDIKIDIVFVHNDEDLDVIRSSIQDLQSIPSYMLYDKHFRIETYNKALQHRGWKLSDSLTPRVHRDMFNNGRTIRVPTQNEIRPFERTTGTSSWF